ncbi:MAG: polysaccharide pyruvyl transferase family protein [Micrococcales bacterium]|nr:polysaccharide pyruvyl transferase family protein [Micrococcales bacterium]
MTTLHVALFGDFGFGNLGNDMSCREAHRRLAQHLPDAAFTALVRDTRGHTHVLGLPAVPFGRPHTGSWPARVWAKVAALAVMVRAVPRYDLVVVPGTGILEEETARMPGGHLVWLASLSLACRVRRVPLVWVGLGGSPYAHRWPGRTAAWAARPARRRSYRDTMTRDALDHAGLEVSDDRLVHDLVLAADRPVVGAPAGRRVVVSAVNVDRGRGRGRYAAVMAQVVTQLVAAGDEVTMVVMDDADTAVTEEVRGCLDGPVPTVVQPPDLDALLTVLADADVVVASRYHTLVGALLVGRPLVAVVHAAKDAALLAQAGLDRYAIGIATMTADDVVGLVSAARTDAGGAAQAGDTVCVTAQQSVAAEMAALAALVKR